MKNVETFNLVENANQPAADSGTLQPFVFDLDGDRMYQGEVENVLIVCI
jgi:hypothetical protein